MSDLSAAIQLFRNAMDALDREDWLTAAALCDPVSLDAFRREVLASFEHDLRHRSDPLEEDILRRSPELPRPVAEYHAARMREIMDPERRLREQFPGVRGVAALQALSPRELFASFLEGRSGRRVHTGGEASLSRKLAERLRGERKGGHRHVVIGLLPDGDQIAHLLYRIRVEPRLPWEPDEEWEPDDDGESWERDVSAWDGESGQEDPDADTDAFTEFDALPQAEQALAYDLFEHGRPQSVLLRRQPDGAWALIASDDFLGIGGVVVGVVTCQVRRGREEEPDGEEAESSAGDRAPDAGG